MLGSRDDAMRRLLQPAARIDERRAAIFCAECRASAHLPSIKPVARRCSSIWLGRAGKIDRERLQRLLEKALNGASCWWRPARAGPTWSSRMSAAGFPSLATHWLSRSIGLRVEDQPDYAYGKWVAAYRDVMREGEPASATSTR